MNSLNISLNCHHKIQQMRKGEILNQIINFTWSILCITPVFWFWFQMGVNNMYFYAFIGISCVMGLLPQRVIDSFQFSSKTNFYKRLGVRFIKKFVQNGDLVASLNKNKPLHKTKNQYSNYLKTVEMYERYHIIALIFFTLTMIYALLNNQTTLSIIILISNILYNLCPILLQQYNKLRINKLIGVHLRD